MRSRRHSLKTIMSKNAPINTTLMSKNIRMLTPPKNKMPMAMTAITMKAPMSGSAKSKIPVKPTATNMGATARLKLSLTSILRTMKLAA